MSSAFALGADPVWEQRIVDEDLAKELTCSICLQLLCEPRQCKNGHLFCSACILQSIEKRAECPQCRCTLREKSLSRSLFVERSLRTLQIYCPNHFLDEDTVCEEMLTLETRIAHERECGFAQVVCQYSPSCGKIRRSDMEDHKAVCEYRPVTCHLCGVGVQSCYSEEHIAKCPMSVVDCKHCFSSVRLGEVTDHLKSACPAELVPCPFTEYGCTVKVLRKDLNAHVNEYMASHILWLKKSVDEAVKSKKESEDLVKTREHRIQQLERSVKDCVPETRIEWNIKNFCSSAPKRKGYLQSDKFKFAGFNWFIGLYTDGDNDESRGYFSIYLFLEVGDLPKGKSVTMEYFLKFVNHVDPSESVKKEFKTSFPIKGGQGWGDRKAVRAALIMSDDAGFLKDGTLHIEAEINVKRIHWAVE